MVKVMNWLGNKASIFNMQQQKLEKGSGGERYSTYKVIQGLHFIKSDSDFILIYSVCVKSI